MAKHIPNRRGLDDEEINALDAIMHEYDTLRAKAKAAFVLAQTEYLGTITEAAEARDDGILDIVTTAEMDRGSHHRGTQSRISEYLKMNPSYLSLRLKAARRRREHPDLLRAMVAELLDSSMNDGSATPELLGVTLPRQHTTADAERR